MKLSTSKIFVLINKWPKFPSINIISWSMRLYITTIMINSIMKTMGRGQHHRETAHANIAMNYRSVQWILFLMSLGKSIIVYQIFLWVDLDSILFPMCSINVEISDKKWWISVPLCTLLRLPTFYLPFLISPWLILFSYLLNLALPENGFHMKRKTKQDTLQTEIKASFHREILAIPRELNQIQTQIIIKIIGLFT